MTNKYTTVQSPQFDPTVSLKDFQKLIKYIECISDSTGFDLSFENFSNMSESDIKSYQRDFKIKKIIDKC